MGAVNANGLRAVVLTYGGGGEHERLLTSLAAEGMPAERVLVVHNPATPGEADPSLPPGCELLRASHNLGYAAAMNRGIERQLSHDPELILLLTHDARLRPGALAALVEAARAEPAYGALGPALVFSGSEEPFSYGGLTRANGSVTHRRERPTARGGIADCDWVDGGTMLLRATALARAGGFDERFWGYCEEAELCLRIVRCGFRVGVVPAAVADQSPGGPKRPGPWAYLLTRNGTAYAQRAAGAPGVAFLSLRAAWYVAIELLRVVAHGLGLRPGPAAEPWAVAVGVARGLLDFYRRRWGPPPPLPGAGDVANLAPPEDGDDA
jgi:N-acetylglucosaminyl-diphospho-decaprenol L-rhamnosyltransferase